jgi:hypothetical protein
LAGVDPTAARFLALADGAGHYESFYLKACHPTEPKAVWIRYTVHVRPGAAPTGSLWVTLFDDGPTARKLTVPGPAVGAGEWIRIGDAVLGPGRASGDFDGASWDVRFSSSEAPLFHLPRDWMYTAKLPRTKLLSPAPAAVFSGAVTVDGLVLPLEGWRGMVGHNWGVQHAERWIWMHGIDMDTGDWIDAAIGRVKIGPATTPWVASGGVSVGGERLALGGLGRRPRVEESPTGCRFVLPGKDVRVEGDVSAAAGDFVGWVYADPDGGEHHTVNCSVSDMRATVDRPGRPSVPLTVTGAAAYELGMREQDHGMAIQPYGDG